MNDVSAVNAARPAYGEFGVEEEVRIVLRKQRQRQARMGRSRAMGMAALQMPRMSLSGNPLARTRRTRSSCRH
jgi:hypothetical protein